MPDSSEIYVEKPDGKSWINWWKDRRGLDENEEIECCVEGCSDIAEGAHVIPMDKKKPVWILPLCHTHNMKPDWTPNINENDSRLVLCPDEYRKDHQQS
jgi:hypothetical protein